MLLHSISLSNFLSYGENYQTIEMQNLNIIIGLNGSGKSNLIKAIELLHSAPKNLLIPIQNNSDIRDWLWKGTKESPIAKINAIFENLQGEHNLRYFLEFTEADQQFLIINEQIENKQPDQNRGHKILNIQRENKKLQHKEINPSQSILSQHKNLNQYPELIYLNNTLSKICLYREWNFSTQKTNLHNEYLEPDASNLGLILNRLQHDPVIKKKILNSLRTLYKGIDDYYVQIEAETAQIFFRENKYIIPATRLSNNTLRYLCLLAILCHPTPPPLICIEEPESGLHPDVLPTLANLIKEASERCQLIITTHSDILVDAMSDQPESVLVAEKINGSTQLHRLNSEQLKPYLEKHSLGQLWIRGEIGSTRW